MSDDIVARLREEGFITHMARLPRESKILHAAADEIERLREISGDSGQLREERDEARREICLLREEIESLRQTISRSQQVSLEWIRETQNRARMIEGSME